MGQSKRLFDFQKVSVSAASRLFSALIQGAVLTGLAPLAGGMSTSNHVAQKDGREKFVTRVNPERNDHRQVEAAAPAVAGDFAKGYNGQSAWPLPKDCMPSPNGRTPLPCCI